MRNSASRSGQARGPRRILSIACAVAALSLAGAARVQAWPLNTHYIINPNIDGPFYPYDYTLPDDGGLYEWVFAFISPDPNATLFVSPPNQINVFTSYNTSGGLVQTFGGTIIGVYSFEGMTFTETETPGLTKIIYQAPLSYDNCAVSPISATVPCGVEFQVWGNGSFFEDNSTAPVTGTAIFQALPEPAAWTLMLVGFGGLGAALRRRRMPDRWRFSG
jgi:hypothetical protein